MSQKGCKVFYRKLVAPMYVNPEMGAPGSVDALYRYPQTFRFARRHWPHEGAGRILDIGNATIAAVYLQNEFGLPVQNTQGNLDAGAVWPSGRFSMVFCMEVIEHVWNPLLLLNTIADKLDAGGMLILSTPSGCEMDWGPAHVVEYPPDRLMALFVRAGYDVIDSMTIRVPVWYGIWHRRYGIRPGIRWLLRRLWYKPVHQLGSTRVYALKSRP